MAPEPVRMLPRTYKYIPSTGTRTPGRPARNRVATPTTLALLLANGTSNPTARDVAFCLSIPANLQPGTQMGLSSGLIFHPTRRKANETRVKTKALSRHHATRSNCASQYAVMATQEIVIFGIFCYWKVLRPAISAQIFLVSLCLSISECCDGSQNSKLLLHASQVAPTPSPRSSKWCVQVLRSPKEAFAAAMQSWRERCEKCVCLQGDYVEK